MIKVTLEFETTDEAIVALGKLVGAPLKVASGAGKANTASVAQAPGAPAATRRGRSVKGQPRGPYKVPATAPAVGAAASTASGSKPEPGQGTTPGSSGNAETPAVTDAGKVATPISTPAVAPASPAPKQEDAQAALSKLFEAKGLQTAMDVLSRHGVGKVRELKPEQYAQFVADVEKVLAGGEA